MSDLIAQITTSVTFKVAKELDITDLKAWFAMISEALPSGVRTYATAMSPDRGPMPVPLFTRKTEEGILYIVPLIRHLVDDETEVLVYKTARLFPNLDFDIIATISDVLDGPEAEAIKLDDDKYKAFCLAYAKKQHEAWLKDRLAAGWRLGQTMDMTQRTSPMIRSWEELPDELKTIDYDHPQMVVDLLGDHGYAVVKKDELSSLYNELTKYK
jgi:hypothetical protein